MTTIVTVLTPGFADWETALLNAASAGYLGITTRYAAPGGLPLASAGGLQVTPDLSLDDIAPDSLDALVLCGGADWAQPGAPELTQLLQATAAAGKVIGGICDGTLPLARSGLLDAIPHTSNSAENLAPTGYRGAPFYRDQPRAVRSGRIITAPGTAPVSFMAEVLDALGYANDDLHFYCGLYAAEHQPAQTAP
jgi:putative intracellular protease/amidase